MRREKKKGGEGLTVGTGAAAVDLGVLTVHTVGSLGDDKAIGVHDGDDVEGVLLEVSSNTGVGSLEELVSQPLSDHGGNPVLLRDK